MALEISGNIEFNNGLTLSSVYGRTKYAVNDDSTIVAISLEYWVNADAYASNKLSLIDVPLYVDGGYEYDRAVDGEDVLVFTQNKIKEKLEDLGFSVVITEL